MLSGISLVLLKYIISCSDEGLDVFIPDILPSQSNTVMVMWWGGREGGREGGFHHNIELD